MQKVTLGAICPVTAQVPLDMDKESSPMAKVILPKIVCDDPDKDPMDANNDGDEEKQELPAPVAETNIINTVTDQSITDPTAPPKEVLVVKQESISTKSN